MAMSELGYMYRKALFGLSLLIVTSRERELIMYMYWIHVHLPQLCCPVDPKGCHPSQ